MDTKISHIKYASAEWKSKLVNVIDDDYDLIVVEGFESRDLCLDVVNRVHSDLSTLPIRKETDGWIFSIDIDNPESELSRVNRYWYTTDVNSIDMPPVQTLFRNMMDFQNEFTSNHSKLSLDMTLRPQINHYPIGGGYLDWHDHPRLPVNYGLIVNLTEKGERFEEGGSTEIISECGDLIKVEDHANIGDLILFKFDLIHRVAPCDPMKNLVFDDNGRWSAILPIYKKGLGIRISPDE